jgi:hypothetical protein
VTITGDTGHAVFFETSATVCREGFRDTGSLAAKLDVKLEDATWVTFCSI